MFSKKNKQPPIKSLIAHGSAIEGHLTFTDGLRIDGHIIGNVFANSEEPSMLVISEDARVVGEIRANHVIINGRVEGPVCATELLELQPKACIIGDVTYKALEMHQGATIAGQMFPNLQGEEKPTLVLAASNS